MSSYNESVRLYTSAALINKEDISKINAGYEEDELTIKEIIQDFKAEIYGNKVVVISGEMYYLIPEGSLRNRTIKREAKWCEEIGIKTCTDRVELFEYYDALTVPESSWIMKNNESYYSPDVSKFNPKNTYYVDNTGSIVGRVDRVSEPTNWYDYSSSNKEWANIVVVSGNSTSYWVWIPRYEYKIDSEHQKTDIKFVQIGQEDDGYEVPECFTFGSQEEGASQTELTGYWISKYELSEGDNGGFEIEPGNNSATIKALATSGKYKIFVDGQYLKESELPCVITGLKKDIMYNVVLVDPNGIPVGEHNICAIVEEIEEPDLSGFNPSNTYYIDSNGDVAGRLDRVSKPTNWYNYNEKEWANIATTGGESVTYWVWIPRYEYQITGGQKTKVKFIPKTQAKPNEGFEIPECFTFGGEQLAGYWISKYELSEIGGEALNFDIKTTSIEVQPKTHEDTNKYKFYIDGNLYTSGGENSFNLPYEIQGLQSGKTYNLLIVDDTNKRIVLERDLVTWSETVEAPDLSGFKENYTYYVIWNESTGAETRTPITENAPEDWYDYKNKKWANIVTTGESGEVEAYWVWIPKYEYKIYGGTGKTTVKFIPKGQNTADSGYEIPESFTFGGKQLSGYWINKYELSVN